MRILLLTLPLLLCSVVNGATVAVVVKPGADSVEKLAASELARYLGKLYPADRFSVAAAAPGKPKRMFSRRYASAQETLPPMAGRR